MWFPAFQFRQLEKAGEKRNRHGAGLPVASGKKSDAPRCLAHGMTKELNR